MKIRVATTLFLLLMAVGLRGQQDTLKLREDIQLQLDDPQPVKLKKNRKFYDPTVASRRSALLPGLGQIYNDSWWKVPIL